MTLDERKLQEVLARPPKPGGCPLYLPVGQPLASVSRSATRWDPFLGLMRLASGVLTTA